IRSVISKKPLNKKDFLHGIPALIFCLDYLPFFLMDGMDKVAIFYSSENINRSLIMFKESYVFPMGFYTALKYTQALIYWGLQLFIVYKYVYKKGKLNIKENRSWLGWIVIFMVSEMFLFSPPFAILNEQNEYNPWFLFLYVGGGTGLTSIFIFLFP